MAVINMTSENFQSEVMDYTGVVLVDFWASWCGPCRMLSPVVDEVAEELEGVKVGKINVDEQPELASQYRIMTIPTLVVLKNGEEVKRSSGVISKDDIKDLVNV